MSDADRSFEAEYNRMLDGFATLLNQQQSTIRTMADSVEQTAMWLSKIPLLSPMFPVVAQMIKAATLKKPTDFTIVPASRASESDASPIVRWWPDDQERPQPRRHWLGRSSLIRAVWEVDQYLMNNMGRLIGRIIEEADKYLTDNPLKFLNSILATVDEYLMTNLPRYVTSIMAEVDKSIGPMIQRHIGPYIDWIMQLLQVGITWLGSLFNAGIQWFASAVQDSIFFMRDVIEYLYYTTIKSLISDLLHTVVYPFMASAVANLYSGIIEPLVDKLLYGSVYKFLEWAIPNLYLSTLRPLVHDLLWTVVYPFLLQTVPGLRLATQVRDWVRNQPSLGPTALQSIQRPELREFMVPREPRYKDPILEAPQIKLPPLSIPEFVVPSPPTPSPLDQMMGTLGDISASVSAPTGAGSITLNGDINVSIAAAAVDAEHADDVARQIASRVLEEIHRLSEIERFSRGLPANGTP